VNDAPALVQPVTHFDDSLVQGSGKRCSSNGCRDCMLHVDLLQLSLV